jgi:hypothetical protein
MKYIFADLALEGMLLAQDITVFARHGTALHGCGMAFSFCPKTWASVQGGPVVVCVDGQWTSCSRIKYLINFD